MFRKLLQRFQSPQSHTNDAVAEGEITETKKRSYVYQDRATRARLARKESQNLQPIESSRPYSIDHDGYHRIIIPLSTEPEEATLRTKLSALFPRLDSVFRRRPAKALETIRLPNNPSAYAGLTAKVRALMVQPIKKNGDADAQWLARFAELQEMAKQIRKDTFAAHGTTPTAEDRETLGALDRLLTLENGSDGAHRLYRIKQFGKAARADLRSLEPEAKERITASIDQLGERLAAGMLENRTQRAGNQPPVVREAPPLGQSIEQSGIYAELNAIVNGGGRAAAKWHAMDAVRERVAGEREAIHVRMADIPHERFALSGYEGMMHPRVPALNTELFNILTSCELELTKPQDRIALVKHALAVLRPAAEEAHRHAVFDATIAAREDAKEAANPDAEKPTIAMREYQYPKGHEPKWYQKPNSGKKFAAAVFGGSPLLVGAAYMLKPQVPVYDPHASSVGSAFNIDDYARREQARWYARTEAEDAKQPDAAGIRGSMAPQTKFDDTPLRTYDDSVPMPAIPNFAITDDRSPEQIAYDRCIMSDKDLGTCPPSPDIVRMNREADEKFGGGSSNAAQRANEALPTIAGDAARSVEPLQDPTLSIQR